MRLNARLLCLLLLLFTFLTGCSTAGDPIKCGATDYWINTSTVSARCANDSAVFTTSDGTTLQYSFVATRTTVSTTDSTVTFTGSISDVAADGTVPYTFSCERGRKNAYLDDANSNPLSYTDAYSSNNYEIITCSTSVGVDSVILAWAKIDIKVVP